MAATEGRSLRSSLNFQQTAIAGLHPLAEPDAVIVVVDGTQLARHLYLALQVLELRLRVVVALCAIALFAPLLEPALTGLNTLFVEWLHHGLDALEA